MSDLKTRLNENKNKNFAYFFDKDGKCYIYHTKFGRERNSVILENDDIELRFKELTKKIYEDNSEVFDKLKGAFEEYLNDYSNKSTIHIKFDENGEFLKTKSKIVDNFSETFGKEKIDEIDFNQGNFKKDIFEKWWDKSINSAKMQGNATNLLKDEKKLVDNLKIINDAVSNSSNLTELLVALDKVEGMKATARELAYFLQFKDDKFPLANDASVNTAKYIFEILNENPKEYNFDNECKEEVYFDFVLEKLEVKKTNNLPRYYILDQFLNLIDKIKKSDFALITKEKLAENDKNQSVYYKLYEVAYSFANLCGKADIKSSNLKGFLELLRT
ncbi:hypothetical protein ITK70_000477, partial [Campylobacter lari]|nr:hypothetical protein [Campylobacter lari]